MFGFKKNEKPTLIIEAKDLMGLSSLIMIMIWLLLLLSFPIMRKNM